MNSYVSGQTIELQVLGRREYLSRFFQLEWNKRQKVAREKKEEQMRVASCKLQVARCFLQLRAHSMSSKSIASKSRITSLLFSLLVLLLPLLSRPFSSLPFLSPSASFYLSFTLLVPLQVLSTTFVVWLHPFLLCIHFSLCISSLTRLVLCLCFSKLLSLHTKGSLSLSLSLFRCFRLSRVLQVTREMTQRVK